MTEPETQDSTTSTDARDHGVPDARETAIITSRDRSIEEKMPSTVQDFAQGMSRTHACDNCGAPTTGKCSECGYQHPELRANPNNPNE